MSKPKKRKERLAAQRKQRAKLRRQKQRRKQPAAAMFADDEGVHVIAPGPAPDQQTLDEMTRSYQEGIRNSPLWEEMVREFGQQRAEELLRQCRAELR